MVNKVCIISLDGATWNILDYLLDRDYMPNFQSFINRGCKGVLKSTIPPISPVAWASFQTGVNPDKHGIFAFRHLEWNEGVPQLRLMNASQIRVNTLWDYLSTVDKKSIVINMPMTYPPSPTDGIIVSGLLTPDTDSKFTYPDSLKKELLKVIPNYAPPQSAREQKVPKGDIEGFVNNMKEIVEMRKKAALYLAQQYPWDVFMIHFQVTDHIQHPLWHCLDSGHPSFEPKNFDKVVTIYEKLDQAIGELLKVFPDECMTIVLSDHGFQRCEQYLYANTLLVDQDLLFPKTINPQTISPLRMGIQFLKASAIRFLKALDIFKLRSYFIKNDSRTHGHGKLLTCYDWESSEALCFFGHTFGLIKVLGDQDTIEKNKAKIINQLRSLRDIEPYKSFIDEVVDADLIYQGPYKNNGPDLLLRPNKGVFVSGSFDKEEEIIRQVKPGEDYETGMHNEDGIFVIAGPEIGVGQTGLEANIIDILPTVLYCLGVPIPRYVDGKVIQDIFSKPPELDEKDYTDIDSNSLRYNLTSWSDDNQSKVEERLKDLGYI